MLTIEAGAEAHTGAWRVAADQSVTQTVTLSGRLHLIRNGELRVMLVDDQGQATRLLIDEALAVGDVEFQAKGAARISEFRALGTTILLVSHNTTALEALCTRAAWLDHGRLRAVGPIGEVAKAYRAHSRSEVRR